MSRRAGGGGPLSEIELPFEEPVVEFHLGDYLDILRRRWRLAAVIAVVSVAVGLVHYFITPKMYQATTTIQIDRRSLSLGGSMETPWLENWWNMEFYPTQYKLLESRGLAERVVEDLRLYEDPVFNPAWARWVPADDPQAATPELDEAALGGLGQALRGGLAVSPIKNTQLVEISYRSISATLAARVANGVAEAFIDWGIQNRSESAGRAFSFLGRQVESLKQEIQDREVRLQQYSRRSDIVIMDPKSNPTLQRLEALNRDYIEAVSTRIDKEARYNEVLSAPEESVADNLSGGLVGALRKELLQLEQEYATQLNVYKPEMPQMRELKSKMDESRQHYRTVVTEMVEQARKTARAEYQTAVRREEKLAAELNRVKEETIELGSAAVEYNNLQMEITTRRQLLDELLRRQSETEVTARLQADRESNVRVVDRALLPRAAFRPSLRKDLGMSLALGLFLGVGCVFLLEYLDRSIKTAEEVERLLGLPVLSVVPDVDDQTRYGYGYGYPYGKKRRRRATLPWRERRPQGPTVRDIELLPHRKPRHAVSEAYRSLRTALLLSSAEELKVVAVTSAQSGEGKTVTAANLAVVLAQLGRRVLLVDADLRKPRQHRLFSISNRAGLVHCLAGGGEAAQSVVETQVSGLWVLPSGATPPNPSELLASARMEALLKVARRDFDVVVVDTPPLLAVTDAAIVGALCDGVVFCLQAGRVLREEAVACVDRLHLSGIKVLGAVVNRYVATKGADGKRYYYYQAYGETEGRGSADSAA